MWNVHRDTINNTGNGNDLSITQKIPQQSTGKHVINEKQKTVILGTADIFRELFMYKCETLNNGKWHLNYHEL